MNLCRFAALTTLTALTLTGIPPAVAQTADSPAAPTRPTQQSYTLIHVSPQAGSDSSGDGSQFRPYQTIAYALSAAPTNAIVLLAPGEYSEASGERFPIRLRSGITVQGAPGVGPVVIRGSGPFDSVTGGLLHATLVAADGAGLGNVRITNPSTAGYGLVVETGRPVIRQNQFSGSGYGGVYVAGQSTPLIEGNYFVDNGVVGLAIAGQSAAEVQGNRFEQTGIGIRVAPGAQPTIVNNTIVQNQEGILLDGSAQPRLENNVIAQNRRNGVIEFQTAAKAEDEPGAITSAIAAPAALQPLDFSTAVDISAVNAPPAIASPSRDLPPPPARPTAAAPTPQPAITPQAAAPVVSSPVMADSASQPVVPEVAAALTSEPEIALEPEIIAAQPEPAVALVEEPPVSTTLAVLEPDRAMSAGSNVSDLGATDTDVITLNAGTLDVNALDTPTPAAAIPETATAPEVTEVTEPEIAVADTMTAPVSTAMVPAVTMPAVGATDRTDTAETDPSAIAAEAQQPTALAMLDPDSLPSLPALPSNVPSTWPTATPAADMSRAAPEPTLAASVPNEISPELVAIGVAPSLPLESAPPVAPPAPEVYSPSAAAPDEAAALEDRLRRIRAAATERIAASQAVLNRAEAATSGASNHAQDRAQEAAAVHEHLRRIRAASTSANLPTNPPIAAPAALSSSAATPVAESSTQGIPIAVIPPPSPTLARATPPTASPPAAAPAQPHPASSAPQEVAVLRVPGGNIPLGRGGSSIPNLPAPTTDSLSNGTMPPPPPSHASMLGLVYKVLVPAAEANTQARVRAIVADAFRVNVNGQPMMQAGAYADQATAEARAAELLAQGLDARVEYRP